MKLMNIRKAKATGWLLCNKNKFILPSAVVGLLKLLNI
jgi:hypothetical protein